MGQITRKLRVVWGSVRGMRGGREGWWVGGGGVMNAGQLRCGHVGRLE